MITSIERKWFRYRENIEGKRKDTQVYRGPNNLFQGSKVYCFNRMSF